MERPVLSKDIIEKRFLDAFKAACPFFPDGRIQKGAPGIEPDFIVENKSSRIGIELARLYRDDGRDGFGVQAQAQFQERVVAEAKKRFEALTNKRFRVFVTFRERSGINNKDVTRLARYLSDEIIKILNTSSPIYGEPITLGGANLAPYGKVFSFIQVYDFKKYSEFSWSRNNVNSVEHLNQDVLLSVIERKERKYELGIYSNCDSVWLLLCMNYFDPVMDQNIPDFFNFSIITSKFERIILYKTCEEIIHQLYPQGERAGLINHDIAHFMGRR